MGVLGGRVVIRTGIRIKLFWGWLFLFAYLIERLCGIQLYGGEGFSAKHGWGVAVGYAALKPSPATAAHSPFMFMGVRMPVARAGEGWRGLHFPNFG